MPDSLQRPIEVLLARKTSWHKRLWVRVSLMLLLLCGILCGAWWWPRRGMVAVWRVDGTVYCDSVEHFRSDLVQWETQWFGGLSGQYFDDIHRLLSTTQTDPLVTDVSLAKSAVDDRWLNHLKCLPNVWYLGLHERQLGPGLDALREHRRLENVSLRLTSGKGLVELRRLPYLTDLVLGDLPGEGIDLNGLAELTQINQLSLVDCFQTGSVLRNLPDLTSVKWFGMYACLGLADDDLRHLQRMPNLTRVGIQDVSMDNQVCSLVSDAGLSHLGKLKHLEFVDLDGSAGQITMTGLASLRSLEKLRELRISPSQLSGEDVKTLKAWFPNANVSVH